MWEDQARFPEGTSGAMEEINGWMDGPTAIILVSKGRGSVDIGGAGEEGEFSRAAF